MICDVKDYWYVITVCDIERLEAVQRRAARFVMSDYNCTSSVTEMFNTLTGIL